MSDEDDKAIANLESDMRGDKPRTVAQNRIVQMMGTFQKWLVEERVANDKYRRMQAARVRGEQAPAVVGEPEKGDDDSDDHGQKKTTR